MSWQSYSDFYQRSDYAVFPQEHRTSVGRLTFRMFQVDQGPHTFSDPRLGETVLALPLSVEQGCNWRRTLDGRSYSDVSRPGEMLIVPAEVESHWDVDRDRKLLVLTVPNETVQAVMGVASSDRIREAFWSLAERAWPDPFVEALMVRLWDVVTERSALSTRLADGIVTSVMTHLLIKAGSVPNGVQPVALPRWRLNRVLTYVSENIGQSIGLDELAAAAGLSRRHFARSFSAELGVTPHKWLIKCRLERAQMLLSSTDYPLAEIAQACGFSSQSHLTSIMRQEFGVTPHRWRERNRT